MEIESTQPDRLVSSFDRLDVRVTVYDSPDAVGGLARAGQGIDRHLNLDVWHAVRTVLSLRTCNKAMDFKRIEPGTFITGSQDKNRQEADGPSHKVTITKPFYIGKHEVTQGQWNSVDTCRQRSSLTGPLREPGP